MPLCPTVGIFLSLRSLSLRWTADATLQDAIKPMPPASLLQANVASAFVAQLRHQYSACFTSSISACEMASLQCEVRCASSQRLEALGECLWSMSVHCVSIFRGWQRCCIRHRYVCFVRNTRITGRIYDPTLINDPYSVPTVGSSQGARMDFITQYNGHLHSSCTGTSNGCASTVVLRGSGLKYGFGM